MPPAKKAVVAAVCLSTIGGVRYIAQTADGSIQPTMTTWLLFCVAVTLSMWTYVSTEKHDVLANVANLVDLVFCWVVLVTIVFISPHPRLGLSLFEVECIAAALLVGFIWRKTRQHASANIALQGILVIAYLPTIYGLWYATTNHESFSAWSIQWCAGLCMLVPPWKKRDGLALLYAARSFSFITLMLFLMTRIILR